MESKELLLRILLSKGNLIDSESYYGDIVSYERQADIKKDLEKYIASIDLNKTKSPTESIESHFNGTFAESEEETIIRCEVYRKGFKKPDIWKMNTYDVDGLCGLINLCAEVISMMSYK